MSQTSWAQTQNYRRERRAEHIAAVLQALRTMDQDARQNLLHYVHLLSQNACRGQSSSLRASCLIEAARQNCRAMTDPSQRSRCELVSDVLITNQLSEPLFIDNRTRYEIMNRSKDVREAILAELRRRYATLLAEYRLSRHYLPGSPRDAELGARLDAYCVEYADQHVLSWQHCVAAVVWFIGTST
jgi:hypothetical protein